MLEIHSPRPSSSSPPPPDYDDICKFIAEYAARLPRHPITGTAPYEYSGGDYALILYALFPTRCVDLSRLCWSMTPLPAQLEANLSVFCDCARGLQLSDAPTSALHPHLLRAVPYCIAAHLRVQHWLYVLAQRFRPDEAFDAATLRMRLRHAQLGEPFLPTVLCEETFRAEAVEYKERSPGRDGNIEMRGRVWHCAAVWSAAPVKARADDALGDKNGIEQKQEHEQEEQQQRQQQQQRKGYVRPWRAATTAVRKPSVTGSASDGGTGSASASANRVVDVPTSLAAQWNVTERRRVELKRWLGDARDSAQRTLFEKGEVDFEQVLVMLRGQQQQGP